jgi:hypothetical protein
MLRGVVGSTTRQADQSAQRGTIDDGTTALRAHLPQFVLHAGPDAAKVDGVHPIEDIDRFVSRITWGTWMPALLNAMSSRPNVATARSSRRAT